MGVFRGNIGEDSAIAPAACIFLIRRLVDVVRQVEVAKLVCLAVLHTSEPGEVGFGQVVDRTIVSAVLLGVIHAAGVENGVQHIIGAGFVGADR